jgi:hypothetical protein
VAGPSPAVAAATAQPPPNLPPVPLDQMLVIINRYLKTSVETLDLFASSCQDRLDAVSDELGDLETLLALVEHKLPPAVTPLVVVAAPHQPAPNPTTTTKTPTTNHNHAAAAKYISMLRVGVPREAVLAKMQRDKVDPALLPNVM